MSGQLRTIDLIVLIVYLAGVFAMGCWFARRSRKPEQFMAAGRSLSGWVIGLSIFGTYVSSLSFLGNPGKAYGSNWNSWVFGLSLPIAAIIAVKYFIPLYRGSSEISAYYHLEKRFGPWARTYALLCYLLSQLARIGTILYLVALVIAPLTGWNIITIILVTGLLVTIYTLLGGIEAVIWTDVVQSVVLIAGALLCAFLLYTGMPDGSSQLFQIANDHDKFSLGSFSLDPKSFTLPQPTFWMVLIYGIFINLQNFGIDQGFVQRYITAKSDRDANFSVWLATIMFPVMSAVFFFIGTGLFARYQADPKLLNSVKAQVAETRLQQDGKTINVQTVTAEAAKLTTADIGDKVFPHFIVTQLPAGIAGLLIAAIFAAAMSSVDTSLNSSATLYLCDIHKRYLRPNASDEESMKVLHIATVAIGIVGTVTAIAMIRVKSALDAWWSLQGIFTGGMLGLFLLGMISRRAKNPPAVVAGIIGLLLILWLSLSKTDSWPASLGAYANPLHSFMTMILGTSSIVLIGTILSRFMSPPAPPASEEK
jgi:solute:Na+ symporter, SSS family